MSSGQGFRSVIREAYTFDDVLLRPGPSEVMPSEVDVRSRLTRAVPLNIPVIASAMDTVTEARMAIAMAQAGAIGVIHRNFDIDGQAAQDGSPAAEVLAAVDGLLVAIGASAKKLPAKKATLAVLEEVRAILHWAEQNQARVYFEVEF